MVAAVGDQLAVLASYNSTGNGAIADGDVDDIRRTLETVTGTGWAVIGAEDLESGLHALSSMHAPEPSTEQERATPGLAFAVTPPREGALVSNERAMLHRLRTDLVAVWELTCSTDRRSIAIVAAAAGGPSRLISADRLVLGGRLVVAGR